MPSTIAIHSFQRGAGRSTLAANLGAILAAQGRRIALIDCDFHQPGLHVFFGFRDQDIDHTLNDYLQGHCRLAEAAYDLTPRLAGRATGKLHLVPASSAIGEIVGILQAGFDVNVFNLALNGLAERLSLDVLVLDTPAGLNENSLPSLAVADQLLILLRLDRQDYQGTAVTVDVARKLDLPHVRLVVNQAAASYDLAEVKAEVERTYGCQVAAVLPHTEEISALASRDIFVLCYPRHPITALLREMATTLLA